MLLRHELPLKQIDWQSIASDNMARVVIPILVVDELDKRKRYRQPTRGRASQTLRTLDKAYSDPRSTATLTPRISTDSASMHLLLDPPRHVRMPDPDRELIDQTIALGIEASRTVTLVTFDTGMMLRARADGVNVAKPPSTQERESE